MKLFDHHKTQKHLLLRRRRHKYKTIVFALALSRLPSPDRAGDACRALLPLRKHCRHTSPYAAITSLYATSLPCGGVPFLPLHPSHPHFALMSTSCVRSSTFFPCCGRSEGGVPRVPGVRELQRGGSPAEVQSRSHRQHLQLRYAPVRQASGHRGGERKKKRVRKIEPNISLFFFL